MNQLPFTRYFAINKLKDGRWSVENLEQVVLTEDDIKEIYSVTLTWLRIRMGLLKGGEIEHDINLDETKKL